MNAKFISLFLALSFLFVLIPISFDDAGAVDPSTEFTSGDLLFTTDHTSITISGYIGPGGDVTIPSSIGGLPVTSIGTDAFKYSPVVKITIPSSVTTIKSNAFNSSLALYEVILPDTLTTIESRAFYNCKNLAIINIPSGLTTIGQYAFAYCLAIGGAAGTITIPSTLSNIQAYAFYNCSGMYNLILKNGITTLGKYAFAECDALETIYLPGTITTITEGAFYGCSALKNVIIANGTTTIGLRAFSHCALLDRVRMSQTVTTIGDYAFEYCTSLGDIAFNKGVTSIGKFALSYTGIHTIYFQRTASVPTIGASWLDGVAGTPNSYSFPWSAFTSGAWEGTMMAKTLANYTYTRETLTRYFGSSNYFVAPYYLPDGNIFRTIGDYAFFGNSDIKTVDLYPITKYYGIGDYSFAFCTNLYILKMGAGMSVSETYSFYYCTSLSTLSWESGTNYIWGLKVGMFQYCWNLTAAVIPEPVDTLQQAVFYGCYKLETITMPATLLYIHYASFAECTSLDNVNIPGTVATVGEASFYHCSSLEHLTLNEGTTKIGSWAFEKCYSLNNVTIPNTVTELDDYCFEYCYSLTNFTLGTGVTRIGYSVFDSCRSMTSFFIPSQVTTLGDGWTNMTAGVFDRCTSLTNIIVDPSNTHYSSAGGVLFNKDKSILIQYPNGLHGAYSIPSSVTWIMPGAFYWAIYLTEVTIPSSCTSVNYASFASCDSLTTVNFPNTLTLIDDLAFQLCPMLDNINIPSSCKVIGNNSFYFARSLETLTIGNGVQEIRQLAFYACTSLVEVTIPDSVYLLDNFSFGYCYGLETVRIGQGIAWIGVGCFIEDKSLQNIYFYSDEVPTIDIVWIEGTPETIRGHAKNSSEFPTPGNTLYTDWYMYELNLYGAPTGLLMGDHIYTYGPIIPPSPDSGWIDADMITSIIMLFVFFLPALILGSMFKGAGVLFGTAIMSVVYGFTYDGAMPILFLGILGTAVIALSLRGDGSE